MPVTTIYQLPYPATTDPNNVPAHLKALAEKVETELSLLSSRCILDIYTAGTWNDIEKHDGAKLITALLLGGGAGGNGGGSIVSGAANGGGGGQGGAFVRCDIPASLITDTYQVIVGAGGVGGVGVTISSGSSTGNTGTDGGATSIRNIFAGSPSEPGVKALGGQAYGTFWGDPDYDDHGGGCHSGNTGSTHAYRAGTYWFESFDSRHIRTTFGGGGGGGWGTTSKIDLGSIDGPIGGAVGSHGWVIGGAGGAGGQNLGASQALRNGEPGALYGGAGGGGGSSNWNVKSGDGGAGANGIAIIITYT